MKIRLTQPGFETYTAQMGVLFFDNGLSTTDVKASDAVRIAAQFLCEWEDGRPVSVAQSILDHATTTTHDLSRELNADQAIADQAAHAATLQAKINADNALRDQKVYTREELEAVAEKEGIKGLRNIAAPLGVQGKAINELIVEILAAQAKA